MDKAAPFNCLPNLEDQNSKVEKDSFIRIFHIVFTSFLIVIFSSCKKEDSLPKFNTELLTTTVWGEENICGYISTPEVYTHIFKPGGQYMRYTKMYQNLSGATWSLIDNETLFFNGNQFKILTLNDSLLEIRGGLCISRYKALSQTKVLTVGVTALSKESANLHGYIRTCDACDVSFEYGLSSTYGLVASPIKNLLTEPSNIMVNSTLSGLLPETVYHYRIKAVNSFGTYYGQDQTFKTFNTLTLTDADNNTYNTVTIGSQTWMSENLKSTKYNDGSSIPLVREGVAWANLNTPGYCWYNNDSLNNKDPYGGLYNWYAVDTKMLCPTGWHVPGEQEWLTLVQYMGQEPGSKLMEGGFDHADPILYSDPNSLVEASNESGFSAQWSGNRTEESSFYTGFCKLWSDTEEDFQSARKIEISNGHAILISDSKKYGLAVRCIKD